jgi:hypothetical protein
LTTTALDLVSIADRRLTLARRELGWKVKHARQAGFSWAQIGQALGGITAQAACKRFGRIADKRHYVNLSPRRTSPYRPTATSSSPSDVRQ